MRVRHTMMAERDGGERVSQGSGALVRPMLAAGLAFLDVARSDALRVADISAWLRTWLVAPGLMPMPAHVFEPGTGVVPLGVGTSGPFAVGLDVRLGRLAGVARVRVAVSLGGLLATPADDRFLAAALFTGRVDRVGGEGGASWRPSPEVTDRLSDVVLSLFAADVLANREEYDACLCVCDICGRVTFRPGKLDRTRCEQHEASGE